MMTTTTIKKFSVLSFVVAAAALLVSGGSVVDAADGDKPGARRRLGPRPGSDAASVPRPATEERFLGSGSGGSGSSYGKGGSKSSSSSCGKGKGGSKGYGSHGDDCDEDHTYDSTDYGECEAFVVYGKGGSKGGSYGKGKGGSKGSYSGGSYGKGGSKGGSYSKGSASGGSYSKGSSSSSTEFTEGDCCDCYCAMEEYKYETCLCPHGSGKSGKGGSKGSSSSCGKGKGKGGSKSSGGSGSSDGDCDDEEGMCYCPPDYHMSGKGKGGKGYSKGYSTSHSSGVHGIYGHIDLSECDFDMKTVCTCSGKDPQPELPEPEPDTPLLREREESECVNSHVGIGVSPYPSLYGWRYMVTEDGTLNCPGVFELGWDDDGKFDALILMRDGEIMAQWGECPTGYQVNEGDYLVFYSDNSHEFAGFTLCIDTASGDGGGLMPAPPEEEVLTEDGCFLSHPEYDGLNKYYQYYGYSFEVMKDGCMTAETFNVRENFSTLTLSTGDEDMMFTGTNGPMNQPVTEGDIVSWKVDDAGIEAENIGFKICFTDICS